MNRKPLLLCMLLALPLPTLAADQPTCAAFVDEIDTHLKEAALAKMLSATSRDPAVATANEQTAASNTQAAQQSLGLMAQHGCEPYPRPVDSTGYHNDALQCAYDILKQRTATPPCDQSTWTLKGRSETWHSFD